MFTWLAVVGKDDVEAALVVVVVVLIVAVTDVVVVLGLPGRDPLVLCNLCNTKAS